MNIDNYIKHWRKLILNESNSGYGNLFIDDIDKWDNKINIESLNNNKKFILFGKTNSRGYMEICSANTIDGRFFIDGLLFCVEKNLRINSGDFIVVDTEMWMVCPPQNSKIMMTDYFEGIVSENEDILNRLESKLGDLSSYSQHDYYNKLFNFVIDDIFEYSTDYIYPSHTKNHNDSNHVISSDDKNNNSDLDKIIRDAKIKAKVKEYTSWEFPKEKNKKYNPNESEEILEENNNPNDF